MAGAPFLELSVVIRAVCVAVAGLGGRGVLGGVLTMLVHGRLMGLCGRMERLAGRFAAGRLWRRRPLVAGAASAAAPRGRMRGVRLWPGRFGWLVRLAGHQAAGYGGQLRAVLETPEMVALLVASPQAARLLRPLCRMLAVETAVLRPRRCHEAGDMGGATAAAVAPVPAIEPARRPHVAVDRGRVPLPRGVLAAARRRDFGKCE